jgi:hypothetical protein
MSQETHILQRKCQQAALALSTSINHRCQITLLAFYKNVAAVGLGFASSLPDHEAVAITIEATVARSCGAPLPPRNPDLWLPADTELPELAEQCRDLLPFSCGFVLIFGAGHNSCCTTFEEIEHMRGFLTHIALPQFQRQPAPQEKSAP